VHAFYSAVGSCLAAERLPVEALFSLCPEASA
jgi:hypothetical protein